ncbi:hypothetical protein [Paenarthrobacter sp. 2TAF44]|uniref:hypothetical protein n=1 Tax=Paenarthrobacter sp. 2TAF44 TaxID=3233018 RepID=UPI003F9E61EF
MSGKSKRLIPIGKFPTPLAILFALTGISALFTDVHEPFWVTWKIVLVVITLGFAAANVIAYVVLWYRQQRSARKRSNQ